MKPILKIESKSGELLTDADTFDTDEEVWIGRSSKCQIRVLSASNVASRYHARLLRTDEGWTILDQSRSGTFVDGLPIPPNEPCALGRSCEIRIAECTVFLEIHDDSLITHDDTYHLSVAAVDFASVDAGALLQSAIDLSQRLVEGASETDVYQSCCEYLQSALAPALSSVYVLIPSRSGAGRDKVLALKAAPGEEIPLVSRRVVSAVQESRDTVAFLQQVHPLARLDATVVPTTRWVGGCLIDSSDGEQPVLLYALGQQMLVAGENHVAGYLRLVATLAKQQVQALRRAALTKYFSPRVVQLLLRREGRASLENTAQVVEASSLFFDLRGFSLSTEASADDLLRLHAELRQVMDGVATEVFGADGTIIDYQGDGLYAAWGVPFDQPDHAVDAVRCALAIVVRLTSMNLTALSSGRAPGQARCGIGIACGPVVAGPVGSRRHFKYGLLGPSVNLASRLESLTKPGRLDAPILITDAIRDRLMTASIPTLRAARVELPGVSRVTEVYEVLSEDDPYRDAETAQTWETALSAMELARNIAGVRDALTRVHLLPSGRRREWLEDLGARLQVDSVLSSWRGVWRDDLGSNPLPR